MVFRRLVELATGLCEFAGRDRKPRNEGEVVLLAIVDHILMLAFADVVLVLHADDVDDLACLVDFVRLDFAETDMADLALALQAFDDGERFFDGHLGVDAMELPEIEPLYLEAAQAHLDLLLQVFGTPDWKPLVLSLPGQSGLGRDHDSAGVGRERLADESLAHFGAVGVGGVDEVYAELDGTLEHLLCLLSVPGFAPDSFSGKTHCAVSQAVDGEIAAYRKGSACGRIYSVGGHVLWDAWMRRKVHGLAFFEDFYLMGEAEPEGLGLEALDGLVDGFAAEAEGAEVHGHHAGGAYFYKGSQGLFGAGVDGTVGVGKVSADGEEGKLGPEFCADFAEAVEVGGVAGVIHGMAAALEDVSAVASMGVAKHACAPMFARGHGDPEIFEFKRLPPFEGMHFGKAGAGYEVLDAVRHDDLRGASGEPAGGANDAAQGGEIEVVHVGVRQQDEVDGRQFADQDACATLPAQEDEAFRKDGIDKDVAAVDLEQKGGVADEGDAEFVRLHQLYGSWRAGHGELVAGADLPPKLLDLSEGKRSAVPCFTH